MASYSGIRFLHYAATAICLALSLTVHAVPSPLSGTVSSDREGPMEGVVVIAQREGSEVLTAVSSDAEGQFAFPSDRLQAGHYTVRVRATGYALSGAGASREIEVTADAPARLELSLSPVTDPSQLAGQLTSLEWVNSFPGTEAQKSLLVRNMVNCGFCHSLERVARSRHSAEDFLTVIQRMKLYETDHSSADRIQIVARPEPLEGLMWYGREVKDMAEYLATINLNGDKTTWDYPLKPLPRPRGEATKAVVTVFPIPRQPSVIHDLDVDSKGKVWYGNTGWDYLGRLDPATGEFSEWEAPNFHPQEPAKPGTQRIVGVQDIQVDPENRVWVAVGGSKHAVFDPENEAWRTFDLPLIWKNPFLSPVRSGNGGIWGTGLPEAPNDDNLWPEHAYRLDIETGELSEGISLFEDAPQPKDPDRADQMNYCYMMEQDREGNFLCTVPEGSAIARADAEGEVTLIPTPTPHAYPRRGRLDDNRFWFTEFFADNIAAIDLDTNEITEYPLGIDFISPYYAHPDSKGRVWASSTGSDRLLRLDPETGELVQYLMPVYYDARKIVVVDNDDRTTIWIPNKNTAQLVRVEVPD